MDLDDAELPTLDDLTLVDLDQMTLDETTLWCLPIHCASTNGRIDVNSMNHRIVARTSQGIEL